MVCARRAGDPSSPGRARICCRCGLPIISATVVQVDPYTCGACRTAQPEFDGGRSFGVYGGRLRKAILALKFRGRERLAGKLGRLLVGLWWGMDRGDEAGETGPWLVVPVPLHPTRERERGFNQAELIARSLVAGLRRGAKAGKQGFMPPRLETSALRRIRLAVPQAGLSVAGRKQNVSAAFEIARGQRIRERRVLLIDDVMTTGETASACAQALKGAGAREVCVLTVARATPEFPDFAQPRFDRSYHGAHGVLPVDDFASSRR